MDLALAIATEFHPRIERIMSLAQRNSNAQGNSSSFIPTAVESLTIQGAALATIAANLNDQFDEAIALILACCVVTSNVRFALITLLQPPPLWR